ncbi:hypothetical protein LZC13_09170, partial [Campylobacter coli]|nr:hypothetical protein [Campylobacter coli]
YRISDNRVMSDWSAFIGEQRSLLESLGSDPQLLQALQVRYHSDRRADQERASPPVAGNGPRIPDTTSAPVRPVEGAAQILGEHDREPVPAGASRHAAQRDDTLRRMADLDAWVRVPTTGPLAIGDTALANLGQDRDWLAGLEVQQALRLIADDQERRILGALDHLAWEGQQLVARGPYADLTPALARWSRDDDFHLYL